MSTLKQRSSCTNSSQNKKPTRASSNTRQSLNDSQIRMQPSHSSLNIVNNNQTKTMNAQQTIPFEKLLSSNSPSCNKVQNRTKSSLGKYTNQTISHSGHSSAMSSIFNCANS